MLRSPASLLLDNKFENARKPQLILKEYKTPFVGKLNPEKSVAKEKLTQGLRSFSFGHLLYNSYILSVNRSCFRLEVNYCSIIFNAF